MNKDKVMKVIAGLLALCAAAVFLFASKEKTIDELELEYDESAELEDKSKKGTKMTVVENDECYEDQQVKKPTIIT